MNISKKEKQSWWKRSRIITHQQKSIESPKNIKSATTGHPKTSCKLPHTIRQGQVVDAGRNSTSPLYSDNMKHENFWTKTAKLTKRSHA